MNILLLQMSYCILTSFTFLKWESCFVNCLTPNVAIPNILIVWWLTKPITWLTEWYVRLLIMSSLSFTTLYSGCQEPSQVIFLPANLGFSYSTVVWWGPSHILLRFLGPVLIKIHFQVLWKCKWSLNFNSAHRKTSLTWYRLIQFNVFFKEMSLQLDD